MSRRIQCASAVLAITLGLSTLGQSSDKPTFTRVMEQRFEVWDLDHDGSLSAAEIDVLCVSAAVKGSDAAAAATLKRIVRSERFELAPLTMDYLTTLAATRGTFSRDAVPEDGDDDDGAESVVLSDDPEEDSQPVPFRAPNWEGAFRQSLLRIERSSRQLFDSDRLPSLEHVHQGPLGDCSFVAVIGAAVKRDPAAVASMITPRPDDEGGGYRVEFGNGRVVRVGALTDSELAVSSTTWDSSGDDGLWLAVLEKAFGTMRMENRPGDYDTETATDAIARGVLPRVAIRLLTGHASDEIVLRRLAMDPAAASDATAPLPPRARKPRRAGDPPGPSLALVDDAQALAGRVRDSVVEALASGRLVILGTADEKLPPGISRRHAYAVLAHDAASDTLSIWNPHGNTFPRSGRDLSDPGLENGYPTRAGIFSVPVQDVAKIFRCVIIESSTR